MAQGRKSLKRALPPVGAHCPDDVPPGKLGPRHYTDPGGGRLGLAFNVMSKAVADKH
jgi:hypothetical protein